MNAAVSNNVANRENIDPQTSRNTKNSQGVIQSDLAETDDTESSIQTVIYIPKPAALSESTPATKGLGRKSVSKRKSSKRKCHVATELYPEISLYPEIPNVRADVPTTSNEEFEKISEAIFEEMNARVQGISKHVRTKNSQAKRRSSPKSAN